MSRAVGRLEPGLIDPSTSSGNVSAGPNSIVGGFVGANEAFTNFPPIWSEAFQIGIDLDGPNGSATGTGSTTGSQVGVGSDRRSGFGAGTVAAALSALWARQPGATRTLAVAGPVDPGHAQRFHARLAHPGRGGQHPGAQPAADRRRARARPAGQEACRRNSARRFFTPPPLGETHFVQNEVVLQIPTNIPPAQLQAIMSRLGLTVLGTQNLGLLGVTTYRVNIGNGATVASVIQALAAFQIVAGAQANYTYGLVQDGAPAPAPRSWRRIPISPAAPRKATPRNIRSASSA